jgi:hypothetical protein
VGGAVEAGVAAAQLALAGELHFSAVGHRAESRRGFGSASIVGHMLRSCRDAVPRAEAMHAWNLDIGVIWTAMQT